MRENYYIVNSGTLKRKDNTLHFDRDSGDSEYIPINKVDSIHAFSSVTMNDKALVFLNKNDVPIHFYNYYDKYSGSFYPTEYLISGSLLVKQVRKYDNKQERNEIAKEIVRGSIYNMVSNLNYYDNKDKLDKSDYIDMKNNVKKLEKSKNVKETMGIEGDSRSTYYSTFSDILRGSFSLTNREYNPPKNAVNAMISFGNSLMYTTTLNEIYRTQLNPTISYLHEPSEARFSLSLDISDIFKPILVDKTIFSLINKRQIQMDDFDSSTKSCLLNEEGRKKFISEYQNRLNEKEYYEGLGRKASMKTIIRYELYNLIKYILEGEEYKSYKKGDK